MKKQICLVLLLALFAAGCSGVWMTARYATVLDKTVALSADTAAKAQAGQLTDQQKVDALVKQAQTWKLFQDARDGKASTTQPSQ